MTIYNNSLIVYTFTRCTEELHDIVKEYFEITPCIETAILYHFKAYSIPCYVVINNKYTKRLSYKFYYDPDMPVARENFYYAYSDNQYDYFTRNGRYSAEKYTDCFIKIHKENYVRYLLHA